MRSFAAVVAVFFCCYATIFAQLADVQQQQRLMQSTSGNLQTTEATLKNAGATTKDTTGAKSVPVATNPKELIIYLETRNNTGRNEAYSTLLTIQESGELTFQWQTKSGKENTVKAVLANAELKTLQKLLNFEKFSSARPEEFIMFADHMQYLTVKKNGKENTLGLYIDELYPKGIDERIRKQLGKKVDKDIGDFIRYVQMINGRFRWQR